VIPPRRELDPWLAAEPGFFEARVEVRRMLRRARRRKLWVLGVAVVVALLAVGKRSRRLPLVQATVTFRVTEGEQMAKDAAPPPPAKDLKEYIWGVAFSGTRLLAVMEQHGLEADMRERDPLFAVESFRENIELYVWRNYFLVDQGQHGERSARLAVTYNGSEVDETQAVAASLAQLVIEEEDRRRALQVEAAVRSAKIGVEHARADLDRRSEVIARLTEERKTATPERRAVIDVEVLDLRKSLRPAMDRLLGAQKELTDLELQLQFETLGAGLRFEKVDEEVEIVARTPTARGLAIFGVLVFVVVLPLAALLVGALDPRIYDVDDVRRLGVHPVGHVPPFRGDEVGSLHERARAAGRL
jgi:hypothetical protein